MEDNSNMLAYDVPLSALLYIVYAGVPAEYIVNKPTEEETLAYVEMLKKIQESENDGL